MDTLEIPEQLEIPIPPPLHEYPVETADYLMTVLLRKQPASLHGEFRDGCGSWVLRSAEHLEELILESKDVGEFRAVLARFGHHHMGGQYYGGHARKTIAQSGRKYACEIFMSNQGWTGYWIKVYVRPT